jgi:uncharacterized protein YjbI with pentapeptide repeats
LSLFFNKLKDSVTSFFNTEFGSATRSFIEALVQRDNSESTILYAIIWQAAGEACRKIFIDKFKPNEFSHLAQDAFVFKQDLARTLTDIEFTIDKHFFREPHRHPQVSALRDVFATWMMDTMGISETNAQTAAAAFPRYFLAELVKADKVFIDKVKQYFEHPFMEAYSRERMKETYHAKLMQQFSCPAFGSDPTISLADLYIEPHFTVFKHHTSEYQEEEFTDTYHPNDVEKKYTGFLKPQKSIGIHTFFESWRINQETLEIKNETSDLLLLLGQPGQGKTSFCLKTMYQLLSNTEGVTIFFMRLRDLEGIPTGLIETPMAYLKEEFSKRVFDGEAMKDKDWHKALLILDGLDELYMNKNMNNEQVRQFLNNFKQNIKQLKNYAEPIHLKCLVTSRHNYVPLEHFEQDEWLILSLDNMSLKQQLSWLQKYKTFKHNSDTKNYLEKLNDKLVTLDKGKDKKSQELRSLINQPILLTMIAQSEIQIDLDTDRAKIYQAVFDTLQNRSWDNDQIASLKPLKHNDKVKRNYRHFLQRLAIHIFQSKEEYVRRTDFEEHKTLKESFDRLKESFGDDPLSIEHVLSSFYFKQVVKQYDSHKKDENHNYAFEFLHKSLQDYLVAEGIWAYMLKLTEKNRDDDFIIDDRKAFEDMFYKLFANRQLSNEIVEYLNEIIGDEKNDKDTIFVLKERLKKLLPNLCQHHFLFKYEMSNESLIAAPIDLSLSMFYGFWSVISQVAIWQLPHPALYYSSRKDYTTLWEENLDYANVIGGDTIKKIFANLIILLCRRDISPYLYLGYQGFDSINLIGAKLIGADFHGADFHGAKLIGANLYGADLRGANLIGADFCGASLRGANLRGANLCVSYLIDVDLGHADLREADLRGANLIDANLYKANLIKASLIKANLREANLRGADFRGADLIEADLIGADLIGAKLSEADLSEANLNEADLYKTDFTNAIFRNEFNLVKNLDKAISLENADFTNTIFEGKIHQRNDGSYWIEGYSEGEL